MHLENVVWDARDPARLGRYWAAALEAPVITDEPDLLEARLQLGEGSFLDLCFPRVGEHGDEHDDGGAREHRLHLDLRGGVHQAEVVERLTGLGAHHADGAEAGQGDVPWVVLADPEGGAFCVMEDRPAYRPVNEHPGPVAALPQMSADPERDAAFWSAITGWVPAPEATGGGVVALRHPDGVGPLLELCPEHGPKRGKNRVHLDVRRTPQDGDDAAVLARLSDLGATRLSAPGELPWLVFADPSGNELCVLDAAQRP